YLAGSIGMPSEGRIHRMRWVTVTYHLAGLPLLGEANCGYCWMHRTADNAVRFQVALLTACRSWRSTSVAMCGLLAPPGRSPSQWPGTARSSTSAARSRMETASTICPSPLFVATLGLAHLPRRAQVCHQLLFQAHRVQLMASVQALVQSGVSTERRHSSRRQ